MVYKRKRRLLDNAGQAFEGESSEARSGNRKEETLKKIGELTSVG